MEGHDRKGMFVSKQEALLVSMFCTMVPVV